MKVENINVNRELEKPLVSIWCATYNHEEYIGDALEGFINQKTDFKYEVIVHDDASTDGTCRIIEQYQKDYPNIIRPIFQKENQYSKGVRSFVSYGFGKMRGSYVAFCEGDDVWIDVDKLQKQIDFLEKNPEYVSCVHNSYMLNMKTGYRSIINKHKEEYDICFEDLLSDTSKILQLSSLLCRKEILNNWVYNPPTYRIKAKEFGDIPLYWYLSLNGKMKYLPDIMSVYRIFTKGAWSLRYSDISLYEKHIENVKEVLDCLNECTYKKFCKEIEERRLQYEMGLLYRKAEFRSILSQRYAEPFQKSSVIYKLKVYMFCYVPFARKYYIARRKRIYS